MLQNEDVKRMATSSATQIQERRMLRTASVSGHQFIIGEDLPPFKGDPEATADPLACSHPNDELRIQGNKTVKAVYCVETVD